MAPPPPPPQTPANDASGMIAIDGTARTEPATEIEIVTGIETETEIEAGIETRAAGSEAAEAAIEAIETRTGTGIETVADADAAAAAAGTGASARGAAAAGNGEGRRDRAASLPTTTRMTIASGGRADGTLPRPASPLPPLLHPVRVDQLTLIFCKNQSPMQLHCALILT
jgi:hypothetical protein